MCSSSMRPISCSARSCVAWSFKRIFVCAASGRQRFNVLGAWNAVMRELIAVTNTTVVNTETMCELLRKIAALGLTGPITLVLDNWPCAINAMPWRRHWRSSWESRYCICRRVLLAGILTLHPNDCGSSSPVAPSTAATIRLWPNFKLQSKRFSTVFQPLTPKT